MARLTMEYAVDIAAADAAEWKDILKKATVTLTVPIGIPGSKTPFTVSFPLESTEGEWNLVSDDKPGCASHPYDPNCYACQPRQETE